MLLNYKPLFVRITQDMDTTHTHKIKKNRLKQEGYNVTDPVYVLLPKATNYTLLTDTLRKEINQGLYTF